MAFSFSLTLRSCGEWHKQHIFLRRDGRERKKVFAMQKVNVAKISLHLSRRGKYQFSSCLQITYDQNSEWNCLLQENAMMHQPKKAEAGFVLFGTCTHWPQCNFRMLTFLWQIQKSRQFNQWNWVNQKKNQNTSDVENAIIGVKQYPVKKVYVLKGTKSNKCRCFHYYHPTIERCQLDAIQDQMVHIHPMCTMVWSCWGPRNSMLRSQLYHIKRLLLLLALVGSLPLLSVSPKPITQAWFVKTMTSSVSLALMELSDFNAEEQCI